MTVQVFQKPLLPTLSKARKILEEFEHLLALHHAETDHLLDTKTSLDEDSVKLIHSLIEEQAKKSPNAIALQFESQETLTYQQLNSTANAIARQLGPVRGAVIPISIGRSTNLIIALLAVLKAGAGYVLLSTDSPVERNKFIVKDTKAPLVLVDGSAKDWCTSTSEVSIEDLLTKSKSMHSRYYSDLNIYQPSSEIAYVIYTSGTTGNPKGVLLSHAAAYTGLTAMPKVEDSEPLRQLLCHSPNFSAAQRTILGTLCRGGTLCLASKDSITSHLNDTINQMGVSSLEITPSMLSLLEPSSLTPAVKKITLGGEAVGPALVESWAGKVELISAYGLSECTQLNMRYQLKPGFSPRTIGKPTDGTTYHILALGSLELVPVGMPGELCLGGDQLAEGYLNLPEKTQEVFIRNPFGKGRLYRTGDMVIANHDGSVDLIGRIDQQTKIDGQRVEPNESNSIIQTQPGVIQSCVISALALNRRSLVAIVVPETEKNWTELVKELRSTLRLQLPAYAIPRFWVPYESLPLTVSGKIDISSLCQAVELMDAESLLTPSSTPSVSSSQILKSSSSGPRNLFETRIVEIVANTLHMSSVSVSLETSFQELGGSSLDAIMVSSSLRKTGIHVSVADILQSASLRAIVDSRSDEPASKPPPPFSLLPAGVKLDLAGLDDAYPVTPLQEGILADSILGNANYVYRRIYRIKGVNSSLLRSAMDTVFARSSILRSSFFPWKRTFIQKVKSGALLPWTVVKDKTLERFLRDSHTQDMPIDGSLVRAAIVEDTWLVFEMHHALFDFWSSQFIVEDTIATIKGQAVVPRQKFSSYVAWQRDQHNSDAHSFWKTYLQAPPMSLIDLSKTQSDWSSGNFTLIHDLGSNLTSFSLNHSVTIGTVLHGAWALTLASLLDTDDVTFVTAFSGRDANVDGVLSMDGPTLCTVPMRVSINRHLSVVEYAKEVQNNLWNLSRYAHSGMRNALASASIRIGGFNTMVNLLGQLPSSDEETPLTPHMTHGDNYTQYITIEMSEKDPTSVKLLVPTSGDKESARAILETFTNCFRFLVEKPDYLVSQILLAMSSVKDSQPEEIQVSTQPEQTFGLAHSAFEQFAASQPTKTAIRTASGRVLSYGDLNTKANHFALWLISRGVQYGEMIPLYMEKSPETLISILGILKAGASFTPLDPANPHDRNAFIIKDVNATRIVTDKKNRVKCASFQVEMIVTEDLNLSLEEVQDYRHSELKPDSIIYAIYTSGSTGLPKGVLVQHSAVTASTEGMIEATGVTSEWNALWVLNYVFDASYYDVFTLFSAGATLCLGPQDELLSNLATYINDLEIEQVMLTPTITKLISGGPAQVPRLKVLNVCGERIDVNILKWAESVDVFNGYGPTEATILMTVSHVKPGSNLNSIGFPLKHVTAVIVDQEGLNLQRVPHGIIGELCVRGAHLAKGYLNRPEQTSKSFITDIDGELLYRTGDLARWSDDGTLECLGRKDYQIKLNGFRIELGEIENALLHTGEVEAAIVSVAEVHGKRQLVAFCIFKGDYSPGDPTPLPSSSRLEQVANLMPQLTTISHYMMPALFLPFTCLPTLPSGKANRKALVALVENMSKTEIAEYIPHDKGAEEFVDVTTDEERVMRQAWASVLDEPEEAIGASSIFLSLGGDSISAINVVAACRQLSYTISVSHILSNPTLAEQAKHLRPEQKKIAVRDMEYEVPQSILSTLESAGLKYGQDIEVVYPAGPGQIEFLIQGHKKEQYWNLTACRDLPKDFDLQHWKNVTTELTARNQILRTMYCQADRSDEVSWYQVVFRKPVLNYEYVYYETEVEKSQYMKDLRDSLFTFGKPNIKYRVLHSLLDGNRTLCIKVDHGSYDGTLLRIFDDQFKAIARGETDLPAVHSFKMFVDWTQRGDHSSTLHYWKESLGDYVPTHNLPLQPSANRLKLTAVNADVESIAAKQGVTASTVFQAAYSIAAGIIAGTTDVLVDNLLTGRNAEVENPQLINGTCANFLPFRTKLAKTISIGQFLKDVQSQFWDTTEHGIVGLQDIYRALNKDRQANSAKLLYCFQPFEPAPATATPDQMRWIVMAQSKVFMSINYAVMLEVQRTMSGHRFKLQWDERVLTNEQIVDFVDLMDRILNGFGKEAEVSIEQLLIIDTNLAGIWKA